MKILNFGSLNIDMTYFVGEMASAGKTVASFEFKRSFGGKGLNQSVALARSGANVFHAGKVGSDGLDLRDFLASVGADVSFVDVSDVPTGNAVIQVDKSGENCIVVYGGANRDVSKEYAEKVLSHFGAGDCIVLQNEISNVRYIAAQARERGMTVFFNPSPLDGLDVPLSDVDWLILNETEAEAIFGTFDAEKIRAAVTRDTPGLKVVMTLGSKGSVYIGPDGIITVEAERVRAVDTTGAGDTYTGYFIGELSLGSGVEKAMKTASRAAGISVTRKGAAMSVPKREEL
ncbi:MAG: ribokinase [Clostridia bacterium]|nr:ribokinase [Clostridia bacterium]